MSFQDRLRVIVASNYASQVELAEKIGLSKIAINSYITGKRKPNYEVLEKFHNLGYSLDWLISGKGSMKQLFLNEDKLDKYDRLVFESSIKAKFEYFVGVSSYKELLETEIFTKSNNKNNSNFLSEQHHLIVKSDLFIRDMYKNYYHSALQNKICDSTFYKKIVDLLPFKDKEVVQEIFDKIIPKIDSNITNTDSQYKLTITRQLNEEQLDILSFNLGCLYYLTTEIEDFNFDITFREAHEEIINTSELKSMFSFLIDQIENESYVESKGIRFKSIISNMYEFEVDE